MSPERDATEITLLEAAHERAKPMLAICRGIQLMNVAFGGTLIQDIPSERPGALSHDEGGRQSARVHPVEIEGGTRLARHIQGLDPPGELVPSPSARPCRRPTRVAARAPDEIIEAIEWPKPDWWAVGVQWHPEELDGEWEAGLFGAFFEAALVRKRR